MKTPGKCRRHGLRSTFADELDAQKTPVTVISKLLGHSNVPTTARYLNPRELHQTGAFAQVA